MTDTIYALSSGALPAAIAVLRISGPAAHDVLRGLAGERLPEPRRAALVTLRADGDVLDRCLALRFDGPETATGEDLVELHLHGGRAVLAAVKAAVGAFDGLREAEPGEFTRRALANGRIDLTEAEGLGDLLSAETEAQRRSAVRMAGGALSKLVEGVRGDVLALAAAVEARLDFADEDDVGEALPAGWHAEAARLQARIVNLIDRPPAERLRDGVRVVIGGPPNAGKSTLLNAIVGREAAITSPVAGTTRDLIEVPVAIAGMPFLLADTAGLRDSDDAVEVIGVDRAYTALAQADIVLWLGAPEAAPPGAMLIHAKADVRSDPPANGALLVSAPQGVGLDQLVGSLVEIAHGLLPAADEVAINRRQRELLEVVAMRLLRAAGEPDLLIVAEELRLARAALDTITGRAGVEDMLDTLFGRFCIGK